MSALKEAGSFVSSMGTRAWLMTMGVIFPGLLISCEIVWLYLSWKFPGEPILSPIIKELGELKALVGFAFLVLALAVSCAVGYLNRDASFAVSNFWLRMEWPPARPLKTLLERLRFIYGKDAVNDIIKKYQVFHLVEASQAEVAGFLPRLPESYVREFCKLWLSAKSPGLSTEGTEIEINIVIGLVTPTALAAAVLFVGVHNTLGIVLGFISLFAACFLLYRINAARVMETENALVNFMFAHWEHIPALTSLPLLSSDADTHHDDADTHDDE
jgi:hypothetical protein